MNCSQLTRLRGREDIIALQDGWNAVGLDWGTNVVSAQFDVLEHNGV